MAAEKEKFIKEDHKGNYDIDGVSYDGEEVIVGGEQPKDLVIRKKTNFRPIVIFTLFVGVCITFGLFLALFGLSVFDSNISKTPTQIDQNLPNEGVPK